MKAHVQHVTLGAREGFQNPVLLELQCGYETPDVGAGKGTQVWKRSKCSLSCSLLSHTPLFFLSLIFLPQAPGDVYVLFPSDSLIRTHRQQI